MTSTLKNIVKREGDPPEFEDVSRVSSIFARCDRYKDFGPDPGRGLPALRGGLHRSLPPNALRDDRTAARSSRNTNENDDEEKKTTTKKNQKTKKTAKTNNYEDE